MNKSKHRVANIAFLKPDFEILFFFNTLGDFENKKKLNTHRH